MNRLYQYAIWYKVQCNAKSKSTYLLFGALGDQLAVVVGVTLAANDENVGSVEAHTAVLLHHGQGHQLDVCQFGPEGCQLLAKDVPVEGKEK